MTEGLSVRIDRVSKIFDMNNSASGELVEAIKGRSTSDVSTDGKVAVNQVSLSLGVGERLGIVGRNGAGKSTLLHMIAGLSDPTSGSIQINGKVTSIMTLGVGLRDDLSGRDNIYVDGEIQGNTRAEVDAVIDQVIEFSELGEFIEYPLRTYSTGMKARLAFAMISHIEPEILIIDEALSVGDASFASKATKRILEICARGKIVILVSHGMQSIKDICNRCIYMKDGQIVMDGAPESVTKAYIDEVRKADEAALLEKFRFHVGAHSLRYGCEIEQVILVSGDQTDSSVLVEAEKKLCIHILGKLSDKNLNAVLRVVIVRMDDLVLFQQNFSVRDYFLVDGKIGLEIEFPSLLLGASIYRLDVFLLENLSNGDQDLCAKSSIIFEVFNLNPPTGGKPMLFYPVSGSVVPTCF